MRDCVRPFSCRRTFSYDFIVSNKSTRRWGNRHVSGWMLTSDCYRLGPTEACTFVTASETPTPFGFCPAAVSRRYTNSAWSTLQISMGFTSCLQEISSADAIPGTHSPLLPATWINGVWAGLVQEISQEIGLLICGKIRLLLHVILLPFGVKLRNRLSCTRMMQITLHTFSEFPELVKIRNFVAPVHNLRNSTFLFFWSYLTPKSLSLTRSLFIKGE